MKENVFRKNSIENLYTEPILEVRNLEIVFEKNGKKTQAVENVSFKLHRSEALGIVGESGSGKSVTSLAIMGLLDSSAKVSGEVIFHSSRFGEIDLLHLDEKAMREIRGGDIAMIFQDPMSSLNPVYTCGDQVMEAILLHQKDIAHKEGLPKDYVISKKEAKQRTLDLFKLVRLTSDDGRVTPGKIFHSYPHEISGGQKQRVMIAMALCAHPSLLIADEPTTALDVTVQKTILELMEILRHEQDAALMFITHDLGVIAEVADRVMVMYQGNVMEQDEVMNIFDSPTHPYTKGLLSCRPRLDFKLRQLPVVADFIQINESGEISEKDNIVHGMGDMILENVIHDFEIEERNEALAQQAPLLEVRNLSKYYYQRKGLFGTKRDPIKAVDDVSFVVYPGETVGLVGESGCGKTTLGRTILRLVEPSSGDIIFEGKRINDYNKNDMRALRESMQIIFQDPYSSLNPRLTVGRAILEPMRIHGILDNDQQRREKVMYLLEKVGLKPEHFNRYPHEFSGGQRQRVCIARTLGLQPKFIIADESVSALDVSVQAQVLNLLNDLKEEFGLTYIFISHDLSVVKFMADRMIVMNQGRIEEMGFSEQIYENPQTEYTQKLISAIPKGTLEQIYQAIGNRYEQRKKKLGIA
ncbi:ABC transporter ATP-binding protein [Eisenibacter elegans]|uniref:ABC transporter ATP-binding protein n=1 Tax=Eisenibacter elegans TaxID=997 RepID=UPI00040B5138|nr:ABC transporter ATP-binding protein [Eisenibacter elegans]